MQLVAGVVPAGAEVPDRGVKGVVEGREGGGRLIVGVGLVDACQGVEGGGEVVRGGEGEQVGRERSAVGGGEPWCMVGSRDGLVG